MATSFGLNVRADAGRLWAPSRARAMQADPGLVRVLLPDGQTAGFGYFEPTAYGQLERWVLDRDLKDDFVIAAAPLLELGTPDLAGWRNLVGNVTKLGKSYRYIKASSEVFVRGDPGWEERIPEKLPTPLDPLENGRRRVIIHQTDTGGKLLQLGALRGYVWSVHEPYAPNEDPRSTVEHRSAEYWLLGQELIAAGTFPGPATSVSPWETGKDPEPRPASVEAFVERMQPRWLGGARLVITGCVNYDGALPKEL